MSVPSKARTVTLRVVAMRTPQSSDHPILEPSKLEKDKTISESEFLERYADNARNINVSGVSQTGYGRGSHCWYILTE